MPELQKQALRKMLREQLTAFSDEQRRENSARAAAHLLASPEFTRAAVVMLFLSVPDEIDTAPIALKAWQDSKTVCVPKVSWEQRHMIPVEIASLHSGLSETDRGIREPTSGKPVPVGLIDLVIVPGLGFSKTGQRIGRGMGFYDRFLGQKDFLGISCGFGFEVQVVDELPVLDHDMPLSMLATDWGIRRFRSNPFPS
jgi:5-formyltetrahydrofolate cyclo-ligase